MKTVIGIIGPIASGKDTAAAYIAKKIGCPIVEVSGYLKELAVKKGVKVNRQNLVDFGTRIVRDYGHDYIPKMLLGRINENGIVTGMRQTSQIEYLRAHSKLVLISIDANPEIRFKRAQIRHRLGEATTLDEFIKFEQEENSGDHVQRLFECMKMADYHIINNEKEKELYSKLDCILGLH
ncbi:AAA family ATPase [Patescibacteria group bacterium]